MDEAGSGRPVTILPGQEKGASRGECAVVMEERQLRDFFTPEQHGAILAAVRHAENLTSGEFRVRLERRAGDDPRGAARKAFDALGMSKTKLRNGVLFYLAVEDHKFVILGDDGIYHKAPPNFWDGISRDVLSCFREGRFAEGLVSGITRAGEELGHYFPHQQDDVNELPDDLSIADDRTVNG
jgi:uncharacterized membrane protein